MTTSGEIPYLDPDQVAYDQFVANFLLKNIPCMFSPKLTSSWFSCKEWVQNEELGVEINFDFLLKAYGDAKVSAVNCSDEEYKNGYGSRDCRDMLFKDYVDYWKNWIHSNYSSTKPCLYLKDWHIVRYHHQMCGQPHSELPYRTPLYFTSDWLNEDCDRKDTDDFKFCYMGPKGSFTSFHADVYGSYSWSANIIGVKRWYLYPPGNEMKFKTSGNIKYDWENPGVPGHDYIEVIQNAGECLFVPSGWHHVVWNLEDTISINHNWFNGANVCYIWKVLQDALGDVEKELEEFREIPEFAEQCQLVLKANHGMNCEGFIEILKSVYEHRRKKSAFSSENQIQFDMAAIAHVIEEHCRFPEKNSLLSNDLN
ncbi:JmjC domain-containing protein 4 [Orchesella cincta]|uniref:Jumonji domain-containing protein 4 n=1 Tax=Orchesella cincta TaxID=48709 RepID=A0A1D2NGA0_ORCCI|nr:JmjC domain-containing protein 4 [Orchesella cincta]